MVHLGNVPIKRLKKQTMQQKILKGKGCVALGFIGYITSVLCVAERKCSSLGGALILEQFLPELYKIMNTTCNCFTPMRAACLL